MSTGPGCCVARSGASHKLSSLTTLLVLLTFD
jgi:hypothetical protein